jgi:hypothetical protein
MTVTVTRRFNAETVTYEKGQATLVDTRGMLLVLDTPELDLQAERGEDGKFMFGKPEMELIRHVLVTYADGEWVSAEVDRST